MTGWKKRLRKVEDKQVERRRSLVKCGKVKLGHKKKGKLY